MVVMFPLRMGGGGRRHVSDEFAVLVLYHVPANRVNMLFGVSGVRRTVPSNSSTIFAPGFGKDNGWVGNGNQRHINVAVCGGTFLGAPTRWQIERHGSTPRGTWPTGSATIAMHSLPACAQTTVAHFSQRPRTGQTHDLHRVFVRPRWHVFGSWARTQPPSTRRMRRTFWRRDRPITASSFIADRIVWFPVRTGHVTKIKTVSTVICMDLWVARMATFCDECCCYCGTRPLCTHVISIGQACGVKFGALSTVLVNGYVVGRGPGRLSVVFVAWSLLVFL